MRAGIVAEPTRNVNVATGSTLSLCSRMNSSNQYQDPHASYDSSYNFSKELGKQRIHQPSLLSHRDKPAAPL